MMHFLEMKRVLKDVKFDGFNFNAYREADRACIYLQAEFVMPCAKTGVDTTWKTRKWLLSEHMTKSELVHTAFKCLMTALEHEAREAFLYKGRPIFGPHFDVDKLHDLCEVAHVDVRLPA